MGAVIDEVSRLSTVLVKHAREAFVSQEVINAQWRDLNFTAPPDFSRALQESDAFLEILRSHGAEVRPLPRNDALNLDSIYTRDASLVGPSGAVFCNMGKVQRRREPAAQEQELGKLSWPIAGTITSPGQIEGGDVVWLDSRTVAVGEGARTNAEGIRQLRAILGDHIDQLIVVPLPDWPGANDVMHLMSLVSPVAADLAVVYARLLPVPFSNELNRRGYRLVDVPDEEFDSMGTNVLALAPRVCVMVAGNPQTRRRLEGAGAEVHEYTGTEISLKGGGGPTCLTRPLKRSAG
jgi:N-dimethylarginine dimethylaminohydrolase